MSSGNGGGYGIGRFLYSMCCIAAAMVGYTLHGSVFFSIVDFIFTPIVVAKWLICRELTLTVLHKTFDFLLS